jgi:hypothetical protein
MFRTPGFVRIVRVVKIAQPVANPIDPRGWVLLIHLRYAAAAEYRMQRADSALRQRVNVFQRLRDKRCFRTVGARAAHARSHRDGGRAEMSAVCLLIMSFSGFLRCGGHAGIGRPG